ncbi:MAG TPA: TonB-dependent receptor [Gemmatimonadaceae bacterium]|nr:TonB-dependent receptor [Gemmatimonadaceae bacterium]
MTAAFRFALVALAAAAVTAHAQGASADIIRGRVVGPTGKPLANVTVSAQSMTDETTRSSKSGNDGRYTIVFAGGDGDYMMTFAAIGMIPKSFEVQKVNDDDAVIVADATLEAAPTQLAAVRVNANRQRPVAGDNRPDVGGVEQTMNTAGIPVDAMGDLSAMAAYLPGVSAIANSDGTMGFSVLGLGSDQNSTLLNGLTFGGTLPRDVQVSARLSTTTFDPSRGGFSGGQITARTFGGSNFINRNLHVTLDHPDLQWADPTTRSLGQQYTNVIASGSASGPIIWNKLFYNTSFQLGRRSSDLQTLLNTDPSALERVGISQDSVSELLHYLSTAGIPSTVGGVPSNRLTDQGALFSQFSFSPTGTDSWGMLVNGSWNRAGAASLSTSAVPAHGGQNTRQSGTVQLSHAGYFGYGFLDETSVSLSASTNTSDAYLLLPDARVLVTSDFPDGTAGVSTLQFGGNSSYPSSVTNYQWQASNATSWFTDDNAHRIKLTEDVQLSRFLQDQNANSRGTFTYNSLADLEAGRPATFTRRLVPARRSGDVATVAFSLGDAWRPADRVQIQYGVRAEGSRFSTTPADNPLVQSTFGVPNNAVPNDFTVSPRLGFSWQVGTMPEIEGFRGAFRPPRYVITGGVGEFRNNPAATLISNAVDQTGLPTAAQQISCVGSAVPAPDWSAYAQNPSTIPSACADGSTGTVFSNSAPNVALFDPGFRTQRSWRANLGVRGLLTTAFNGSLTFTYSRNLDQRGSVDLNFLDTPQFALADEGGRPVYVAPSSIVPSTGSIAAGAGRVSSAFSRVSETTSDLRSTTRELQFAVSPRAFNSAYAWNVTYVYRDTRDLTRGFGGTTAGDPLATAWESSGAHHEFNLNASVTVKNAVNISTFVRVSSGNRFTPMVSGDVNGDGYANDRAFVFNPTAAPDSALRSGMQALLDGLSGSPRACLERQLGQIAGRNSCVGPWSVSMSAINIQLVSDAVKLPSRLTVGLSLSNPLTGADALVHGGNHLSGWGQTPVIDPTLLYVRGFDPATDQYRYEVNPRFGNSAIAQTAARAPFRATLDVRVAVGPDRDLQQLEQLLRGGGRGGRGGFGGFAGRGGNAAAGGRPSEMMIKNRYVRGYPNPMDQMLRQRDSLKLSDAQTDSLIRMNKAFTNAVDSIWTPIARYLVALPEKFDVHEAYDHVTQGENATIDLLVGYAPRVKGLLTADQLRKLPPFLAAFLDPNTLKEIRPGRAFGFGGRVGGGGFGGGGGGRGGRGG